MGRPLEIWVRNRQGTKHRNSHQKMPKQWSQSHYIKCFKCSHACAHLKKIFCLSNMPRLVRLNMGGRSRNELHLGQSFFEGHAADTIGKTGSCCCHALHKPKSWHRLQRSSARIETLGQKYLDAVAISCVSCMFETLRWLHLGWEQASQINVITIIIPMQHLTVVCNTSCSQDLPSYLPLANRCLLALFVLYPTGLHASDTEKKHESRNVKTAEIRRQDERENQ